MDAQSDMMATDLQDLSSQASPDPANPDVLASTVTPEDAANAVSVRDPESACIIDAFNISIFYSWLTRKT